MKVYSVDGCSFMDLEELSNMLLCEGFLEGQEMTVETGTALLKSHYDYIDSNYIIERAQDAAFEDMGDCTKCYLGDVSDTDIKELNEIIVKFLNERVMSPFFYGVSDVKEEVIVL